MSKIIIATKDTCSSCKREYVVGWNGTVNGCDECQGNYRDREGNVWGPGVYEQTYKDVRTGKLTVVKRP